MHTPPRKLTANPLSATFVKNKIQLTIALPPKRKMGFANLAVSVKMPAFAAFARTVTTKKNHAHSSPKTDLQPATSNICYK